MYGCESVCRPAVLIMEDRRLCFSHRNGRESGRKPSGRATIRALLCLFLCRFLPLVFVFSLADNLPIKSMLKQSTLLRLQRLNCVRVRVRACAREGVEGERGEIHTALPLDTHAHTHQMAQEGGLNKHTHAQTHTYWRGRRLCAH